MCVLSTPMCGLFILCIFGVTCRAVRKVITGVSELSGMEGESGGRQANGWDLLTVVENRIHFHVELKIVDRFLI